MKLFRMMRVAFLVGIGVGTLFGQQSGNLSGTIAGEVYDAITKEPIPGANVLMLALTSGLQRIKTDSFRFGMFLSVPMLFGLR